MIGARPHGPDLAERYNETDLPRLTGIPLIGTVPEGVGAWPTERFRVAAPAWFTTLPF